MPRFSLSFQSLWALLFPRTCLVCGRLLVLGEELICLECTSTLPLSHLSEHKENHLSELFAGRIPIRTASALLRFEKGNSAQHLIHQFKYYGQRRLAYKLGRIYGYQLSQSPHYKEIDMVIPVPLHPFRRISRGYNQSEYFARGIADELSVEVDTRSLRRTKMTNTQARRHGRDQRWSNVVGAFTLTDPKRLLGRNILVVDDVITTGSTIQACIEAITRSVPSARVSIGACACIGGR